ncbi:hypothetical protein HGRIS_004700 [Hohenbuehelia grisea]|uniref:Uncharacterized protein n=1 Tax=Hohenbuehelia grisea TaxID=104357 RepID=A0ABR3JDI5_9AGAR
MTYFCWSSHPVSPCLAFSFVHPPHHLFLHIRIIVIIQPVHRLLELDPCLYFLFSMLPLYIVSSSHAPYLKYDGLGLAILIIPSRLPLRRFVFIFFTALAYQSL